MDSFDQPSIPSTHCLSVVQAAQRLGASAKPLLARAGIDAGRLAEADALFSATEHLRLVSTAADSVGPRLGMEMGLVGGVTKHGMLGFGLMCCANLGEALGFFVEFQRSRTPFFGYQLAESGGRMVLIIQPNTHGTPLLRRLAVEAICSEIYTIALALTQNAYLDVSVDLDYPEPAYFAAYRTRLPTFNFNAARCQISLPVALLALSIPTANALALVQAKRHCQLELAARSGAATLTERVKQLLCDAGYSLTAKGVAQKLGMSGRTLRRRLAVEGLSFRDLKGEALIAEAGRRLEAGQPSIAVIAQDLGFADTAHFSRAFKRRVGVSPSEYRRAFTYQHRPAAGLAPQ